MGLISWLKSKFEKHKEEKLQSEQAPAAPEEKAAQPAPQPAPAEPVAPAAAEATPAAQPQEAAPAPEAVTQSEQPKAQTEAAPAVEEPVPQAEPEAVELEPETAVEQPAEEAPAASDAAEIQAQEDARRAEIEAEKARLIEAAAAQPVAPATVGVAPDLPQPEADNLASKQEASTWYLKAENEFGFAKPFEFHPYENPRIASLQQSDKWYSQAEGEAAGAKPFEFEPYEDPHRPSLQTADHWYGPAEQEAVASAPFQFIPYAEPVKEEPAPETEAEAPVAPAQPVEEEKAEVASPVEEPVVEPEPEAAVEQPEEEAAATPSAADLQAQEDARKAEIEAEKARLIEAAAAQPVAPATVGIAPDLPQPEAENLASKQEVSTWYSKAENEFGSAKPFEFHPYEDPRIASLQQAGKWYSQAEGEAAGAKPFEFEPYEDPHRPSLQTADHWYGPAEQEAANSAPFQFTPYVEPVKEEAVPETEPESPAASEQPASQEQAVQEEKSEPAEEAASQPAPEVQEQPESAAQPTPKGNADELDDLALYNLGLGKAREGFSHRLSRIAKKYKQANAEYFDELEECLIEADVGVDLALRVLDTTETMAAQQHISDTAQINDLLVDNMFMDYAKTGGSYRTDVEFDPVNPTVLMVVGVNGTGKTTTIAKLALRYKEKGKKVLVVAADTFRAGAVEQLRIWAGRVGVDCYDKGMGAEPAAVCYDAVHKAIDGHYDLVIVDTAGRLHTKDYLMKELGKLVRVIGKIIPNAPQEVWLALDANTGQNGVQQSKVFKEVCSLTGIVITKMDGTSKGGIILAIRDQLGIPVRFIGLGEHEHDLREFDLDKYLYGLLVGGEE